MPKTGTGRYTREIVNALAGGYPEGDFVLVGPGKIDAWPGLPHSKIADVIEAGPETLLDPAYEQFTLPSILAGADLYFSPTGILPLARSCPAIAVLRRPKAQRPGSFARSGGRAAVLLR